MLEERCLLTGTPFELKDIPAGYLFPASFTDVGSVTYFEGGGNAPEGAELWVTDGTTLGTALVKDINVGASPSLPTGLTNLDGKLLFFATDDTNGRQLWISDPTDLAATHLLKKMNPSGTSFPANWHAVLGDVIVIDHTFYFPANNGTDGMELWKSDGTTDGTVMVKNLDDASTNSYPSEMTNVNGVLYFTANGPGGRELWKSDGTIGGTEKVTEDVDAVADLENMNGTLYFRGTDNIYGEELWKSNSAGTEMVKDIREPGESWDISSRPNQLINIRGVLYFAADDGVHGAELWRSDGTKTGTVLVKDINETPDPNFPYNGEETEGSSPSNLTDFHGTLLFQAYDGSESRLWRTDRKTDATYALSTGIDVSGDSIDWAVAGGRLYFSATDNDILGNELWSSNGKVGGTEFVANINPYDNRYYNGSSNPEFLAYSNWLLFFRASNGTDGTEPWALVPPSYVEQRLLFYNGSTFDGNNTAINASDDLAIATDKSAYLPGDGLATFPNVSSYSRGINGIMIDLSGPHGTITANDFTFRVGNNNSPSGWSAAPAPAAITVRPGAGLSGSDRVVITWANGDISDEWLEVIFEGDDTLGGSNTNTGLEESDVFFFGNKVGDTGNGTPATTFVTSAADKTQILANLAGSATISSIYDINRDGNVTAADGTISFGSLGSIVRIQIGSGGPFAPERDGGGNAASAAARSVVLVAGAAVEIGSCAAVSLDISDVATVPSATNSPPRASRAALAGASTAKAPEPDDGVAGLADLDGLGLNDDLLDSLAAARRIV